ncbi:MAG: 50S ribosomal protein L29 [Candidatus Kerfeldbacteria bacterium]|nr:50S ribosomal protein L29 [Candidatus Kerfeldbacteria bacterium]
MKLSELRTKHPPELTRLLAAEREHLRDLRFRVNVGQLKHVREIRKARQFIAHLLTVLKEKEQHPAV